jgi:hypothetical protein
VDEIRHDNFDDIGLNADPKLGWTCSENPEPDPCGYYGRICAASISGTVSKTYTGLTEGDYYLDLFFIALDSWQGVLGRVKVNGVDCFGAYFLDSAVSSCVRNEARAPVQCIVSVGSQGLLEIIATTDALSDQGYFAIQDVKLAKIVH